MAFRLDGVEATSPLEEIRQLDEFGLAPTGRAFQVFLNTSISKAFLVDEGLSGH